MIKVRIEGQNLILEPTTRKDQVRLEAIYQRLKPSKTSLRVSGCDRDSTGIKQVDVVIVDQT